MIFDIMADMDFLSTSLAKLEVVPKKCSLLRLPPELRNRIWELALKQDKIIDFLPSQPLEKPPVLEVCKQIRSEAGLLFFTVNRFRYEVTDCTASSVPREIAALFKGQCATMGGLILSYRYVDMATFERMKQEGGRVQSHTECVAEGMRRLRSIVAKLPKGHPLRKPIPQACKNKHRAYWKDVLLGIVRESGVPLQALQFGSADDVERPAGRATMQTLMKLVTDQERVRVMLSLHSELEKLSSGEGDRLRGKNANASGKP